MKLSLPRKRTILAVHRWLGLLAALFLLILALTGLALNHNERLGLNKVTIGNSLLLGLYGMKPEGDVESYRILETDTLSWHAGQYFVNGTSLAGGLPPLAVFETGAFTVVVTPGELLYLTLEGELIELLPVRSLPFDRIISAGRDSTGRPVLDADGEYWRPDSDWMQFRPEEGEISSPQLEPVPTPPTVRKAILAAYRGEGITLYRLLLDLHSGRLLGWGGRTVMDLAAVAILILVSSGIGGWLRKSRWGQH